MLVLIVAAFLYFTIPIYCTDMVVIKELKMYSSSEKELACPLNLLRPTDSCWWSDLWSRKAWWCDYHIECVTSGASPSHRLEVPIIIIWIISQILLVFATQHLKASRRCSTIRVTVLSPRIFKILHLSARTRIVSKCKGEQAASVRNIIYFLL